MITFKTLASSSHGNAYLASCEGHRPLLFDAGLPLAKLMEGTDFGLSSLAGVLVSHGHGDHMKGVKDLLKRGANVYASFETWNTVGLMGHHRAHLVSPSFPITIGMWTVRPFEAVHDSPGTLGYYVISPAKDRLLYLTDSAYSPNTFAGLNYICVEANYDPEILREKVAAGAIDPQRARRTIENHMSLPTLLEMLQANDLTQLKEVHLLHLSDSNSDEVKFKEAVQRKCGCPVYVSQKQGDL